MQIDYWFPKPFKQILPFTDIVCAIIALVSDAERKLRAEERRARIVISRHRLGDPETDLFPIRGAEAISLAARLTREAWSLSGQPFPDYDRANTPYRFVKGFPE